MKIIFLTLFLISSICFGKENKPSQVSKEMLSAQFDSYLKQKTKEITGDVEKDVMAVAKLDLDEQKDFNLLQNVLLTLVKLDETDPTRTTTMMLSQSYDRYKKLYKNAFASIKTPKNKNIVEELEKLIGDFNESGNG